MPESFTKIVTELSDDLLIPISICPPFGVNFIKVESAFEMFNASIEAAKACDIFIGAAAVLSPLAMSSSRDDPSFAYSGKAHQVPRLPSANPLRRVNPSLAKENLILRYAELHERCGHQHPRVMRKAVDFVTRSGPSWTNCGLTGAQIMRASKLYTCPYCVLSKRRRDPVPVNVDPPHFAGVPGYLSSKIAAPGDIISFDPQTCTPAASDGSSNWFLFKDISTGMNHVTFSTDAQMPTV